MVILLIVIICYFIGSIPFSYIAGKSIKGYDIRQKGSGNVGATNVLRTAGAGTAAVALVGDVLKGAAGVLLGLWIGGESLAAICALFTVLGHCFSPFLNFKGGKGVATAAGAIIILSPKIFLLLAVMFIVITVLTHYVSLASIAAALLFPILNVAFFYSWTYMFMSIIMAAFIIYKHKDNIERLRNGNESKITDKY